ncbi:PspC domain-containing protein [Neobacillus sp. PS3-40]|jgi:phage shock protein C|uniref:PspC domain-containing protein n=1 Tax=Neobacillus sp. PS3-40 TaxID=3070679 RepID=UPI0027E03464|nr:PspC domain-containing protein [Neobacillus sp. PS3-40]WML46014.1 PspC domain-containing protein [Neobacillus sp. PS3-40]
MKKWMRSRTNRMLAGVIGGLSEVIGMDAKLLRIIFIILLMVTGFFPMGLLYILLVFIMPNEQRLSK